MRKIVLWMSVSLDGYMAGPDGELDWHRVDDELHQHFNEDLAAMSAFLDGRVTYELMAGFWPTADADPASTPVTAEFARIWRDMPKVVYSRTLREAGWNTVIRREIDPAEIAVMKALPGGDMALGGAVLADGFRRLDLIDAYRIYVHPVLIGRGKPLFAQADAMTGLRLERSRTFGNGVVMLHYEREN
jgi:dihydrofolate reductase